MRHSLSGDSCPAVTTPKPLTSRCSGFRIRPDCSGFLKRPPEPHNFPMNFRVRVSDFPKPVCSRYKISENDFPGTWNLRSIPRIFSDPRYKPGTKHRKSKNMKSENQIFRNLRHPNSEKQVVDAEFGTCSLLHKSKNVTCHCTFHP